MIKLMKRTKAGLINISDNFYAPSIMEACEKEDVIYFNQCTEQVAGGRVFNTLHIQLEEEEILLKNFDRRTRTDIRKVRETKSVYTHFVTDVDETSLNEFRSYYNDFAKEKGISTVYDELVTSAMKQGNIAISKACYGVCCDGISCKKDDVLSMHLYLIDDNRSRLLYSASSRFSFEHLQDKHFVARANRTLHIEDMNALRELGRNVYDFGGLFLDDEPSHSGIDRFKKGFGGEIVQEYSYDYPVTFKGKIYLKVRAIVESFKS